MSPRLAAAPAQRIHSRSDEQDDLAASMDAFDAREHARLEAERKAHLRRLAAIARDASMSVEERIDAMLAGISLSKVLWTLGRASGGAVVLPCDGKHVNVNKAAFDALLKALPRVGLVGARDGQKIIVSAAAAPAGPPPPSGRRPLLAADPRFQELRRAALTAFAEIAGDSGPDVERIGGPDLHANVWRELADLRRDLSHAAHFPSVGALPRVAALCAQRARDVATETGASWPSFAMLAWQAAEACVELARYADEWAIRQAGGAR